MKTKTKRKLLAKNEEHDDEEQAKMIREELTRQ